MKSKATSAKKNSQNSSLAIASPELIIWPNKIVPYDADHPEWIDPVELLANPKNARIHPREQSDALTGSISTLGWLDRAKINSNSKFLFDGHERVRLAIEHKQPRVPVTWYDLTEAEEDLALAIFDEITGMAGIDQTKRRELLNRLGKDIPLQSEVLIKQLRLTVGLSDIDFAKRSEDIENQRRKLVRFMANQNGQNKPEASYQILVMCPSEADQVKLLQTFAEMGLDCRSLVT